MRIRYWGTRGSIPTPGPSTVRYGGNTACVEVRTDSGNIAVLDCGSGARGLGQAILHESNRPKRINILLTHTHWDHIQGFPFFGPAFAPGFDVHIFGPAGTSRSLEHAIAGQMDPAYFPVSLQNLASKIQFRDLGEGTFEIGDMEVTTRHLNHTAPTIGYRIVCNGRTLIYATDHEPPARFWHAWPEHWEPPGGPPEVDLSGLDVDELSGHIDFARGADLMLHDAQYVEDEYPIRRGWGHSTVEYATEVAIRAGVKRLILFHHDPYHNDRFIDQALQRAREMVEEHGVALEVEGAMEGAEEFLIEDRPVAVPTAPQMIFDRTRESDEVSRLRSIGLFERLDPPDLRAINDIGEIRPFQAGQELLRQGQPSSFAAVVVDGLVEATAQVPLLSYSALLPLTVLGGGESFSELALLDTLPSPATFRAVGVGQLLAIERTAFLGLLEDRPHMAVRVFAVMAREIKRQDEIINRVLFDPVSGAYTRAALEEYYRREVDRIQRQGGRITLLCTSIEGIGNPGDDGVVFDRDDVMRRVARAMKVCMRETDLNARFSWSEFVTLLVDTDERGGWVVAERLNRILSEIRDLPSQVRWRIGVSSDVDHVAPLDVLVGRAHQGTRTAER